MWPIKQLSREETKNFIGPLGLGVTERNAIAPLQNGGATAKPQWVHVKAPNGTKELLTFVQRIVAWPPAGQWILLQIDDESFLDAVGTHWLEVLLFGAQDPDRNWRGSSRSFLISLGTTPSEKEWALSLVSQIGCAILQFEHHCYLISSESRGTRYLALQDGFAYLFFDLENEPDARALAVELAKAATSQPAWVADMERRFQES